MIDFVEASFGLGMISAEMEHTEVSTEEVYFIHLLIEKKQRGSVLLAPYHNLEQRHYTVR
jgi:hypothetical protein